MHLNGKEENTPIEKLRLICLTYMARITLRNTWTGKWKWIAYMPPSLWR